MHPDHRVALAEPTAPVFPPALVRVLRERLASDGCLEEVADEIIVQLLTTVFFAGLETYEGERNPIGVAFLGKSQSDFIMPEGTESGEALLYQWKSHAVRLASPLCDPRAREARRRWSRPPDLSQRSASSRMEAWPSRGSRAKARTPTRTPSSRSSRQVPGPCRIRRGRDLLLGYERGTILTGGEELVFSAGPIRRALETTARCRRPGRRRDLRIPGCRPFNRARDGRTRPRRHRDHQPRGATASRRVGDIQDDARLFAGRAPPAGRAHQGETGASICRAANRAEDTPVSRCGTTGPTPPFGSLLRNALLTEVERVIEEFGALTAIDGAVLLNRDLALIAFGVILPVGRPTAVAHAVDAEGLHGRIVDLGSRGTRHRAASAYAARHPGSVVFVASEDGQVSCVVSLFDAASGALVAPRTNRCSRRMSRRSTAARLQRWSGVGL